MRNPFPYFNSSLEVVRLTSLLYIHSSLLPENGTKWNERVRLI